MDGWGGRKGGVEGGVSRREQERAGESKRERERGVKGGAAWLFPKGHVYGSGRGSGGKGNGGDEERARAARLPGQGRKQCRVERGLRRSWQHVLSRHTHTHTRKQHALIPTPDGSSISYRSGATATA